MQGPSIFGSLVSQVNEPKRPTRFMSVLDDLRRTGTVTSHGQDSSNVHNSQFVIRHPRPATAMLYDGYAQDKLEKRMATASQLSHVRRSSSATPECKESTLSELATSFTPAMHSSSLGDWRKSRNVEDRVDGISSRPRSGSQCIIVQRVSTGSRGASTLNGPRVLRERPASSTAALHSNNATSRPKGPGGQTCMRSQSSHSLRRLSPVSGHSIDDPHISVVCLPIRKTRYSVCPIICLSLPSFLPLNHPPTEVI